MLEGVEELDRVFELPGQFIEVGILLNLLHHSLVLLLQVGRGKQGNVKAWLKCNSTNNLQNLKSPAFPPKLCHCRMPLAEVLLAQIAMASQVIDGPENRYLSGHRNSDQNPDGKTSGEFYL